MVGLVILLIALLWLGLEHIWEPQAIKFLSKSSVGRLLVAFVPYTPILLVAIGGYFMAKSKEKPLFPSKDQINNDKY